MDSAAANLEAQGHRVLAAIPHADRRGYRRPRRDRGLPAPMGALGRMGGSEAARAVRADYRRNGLCRDRG